MKFRITMKDPDGLYESIARAADGSICHLIKDLSDSEVHALVKAREEELKKTCEKWFEYDEYVTIEIDTEANTATVIEI